MTRNASCTVLSLRLSLFLNVGMQRIFEYYGHLPRLSLATTPPRVHKETVLGLAYVHRDCLTTGGRFTRASRHFLFHTTSLIQMFVVSIIQSGMASQNRKGKHEINYHAFREEGGGPEVASSIFRRVARATRRYFARTLYICII